MPRFYKNTKHFLIRTLTDVLIVLTIGLSISLIFSWGTILKSSDYFLKAALYSLIIGFSLWKSNEVYTFFLERIFPWHKRALLTLILDISGTIIISAIVIVLVNHYFYFLISEYHFKDRPQYFILVGVIQLIISLVISSVFYITRFFKEWRKLLISEEKLKQEALASQYEALKSYVNPHFLFNSLSVLDSLVDTDPIKAKEFISKFSDVYRYVLHQKDKDLVPLTGEIEFVKSYISLLKIRQGDALQVNIEISDSSGMVVPVALQILLENAFKHNEASMENPLEVSITRVGDDLMVVNNYQPRKVIIDNQGIGLKTIGRRYAQLSNREISIVNENGLFKVCLPVIADTGNANS